MFSLTCIHMMGDTYKAPSTRNEEGTWESESQSMIPAQVQILFQVAALVSCQLYSGVDRGEGRDSPSFA
jgi:hypothetical protein